MDEQQIDRMSTYQWLYRKKAIPTDNNCTFLLNPDNLWQCTKCNWVYPHQTPNPPKRNCPESTNKPKITKASIENIVKERKTPGMTTPANYTPTRQPPKPPSVTNDTVAEGEKLGWTPQMIRRYASAITEWIAAGRPVRDDEEVKRIYEICAGTEENNHTDKCPKYKADEGRCSVCGCRVRNAGLAILNKAKMLTQHCPDGKW